MVDKCPLLVHPNIILMFLLTKNIWTQVRNPPLYNITPLSGWSAWKQTAMFDCVPLLVHNQVKELINLWKEVVSFKCFQFNGHRCKYVTVHLTAILESQELSNYQFGSFWDNFIDLLLLAQGVGDQCDNWINWPEYQYGSSTDQGVSIYQVWSFWGKVFLSYPWHKVWEKNMTFDLDIWTTDLNINRGHLLIWLSAYHIWSF